MNNFIGIHIHNIDNYKVEYGAKNIRIWDMGVTWANLEKKQGEFDFLKLDHIVDEATKKGLKILYVLGMTPRWATTKENVKNAYPVDEGIMTSCPNKDSNWSIYILEILRRYSNKIKSFQVWNEIDNNLFWSGSNNEIAHLIFKTRLYFGFGYRPILIFPSFTSLPSGIIKLFQLRKHFKQVDKISLHSYKIPFIPVWLLAYQYALLRLFTKKEIVITEYGVQLYKHMTKEKLDRIINKFHKMFKFFGIKEYYYYAMDNNNLNEGRII